MPNYVTSKCQVVGPTHEIDRFKATVIREAPVGHSDAGGMMLDFNAIIPMPESVRGTEAGGHADIGIALIIARGSSVAPFSTLGLYEHNIQWIRGEAALGYDASISDVAKAFLIKHAGIAVKGLCCVRALVETGYTDWYSWSIANWGTKWGAFRFVELNGEAYYSFQFETAWSFPTPIFHKLAVEFPLLGFNCVTFDEGGNFAGDGWFNAPKGGKVFEIGEATDALYERVYGHPRPTGDDEDDSTS
mgnify:FL=1